jgi:autotransporter-associated beta strand protein
MKRSYTVYRSSFWANYAKIYLFFVSFFLFLTIPASAQVSTWNNSGTDWGSTASWTPNVIPTISRTGQLTTASGLGSSTFNTPIISGTQLGLNVILGDNYQGAGWGLSGSGTLLLGNGGFSGTLLTRGVGNSIIDGPQLAGTSGKISFNICASSTLTLSGNSLITTNPGIATIRSGTLSLDNSISTVDRINGLTVTLSGGTLALNGNNNSALTMNAGPLRTYSGTGNIQISDSGNRTTLNFANITGNLRDTTSGVIQFEAVNSIMGASNGAQVTFTTPPFLGANGLLADSNGSLNTGWATVKDVGGKNFATYGTNGVSAAIATATTTNSTDFLNLTANDRAQFNDTGSTITPGDTITSGSLRISANGGTLVMDTHSLTTNALMIDGGNFTLSGTGNFDATNIRYIYVNNSISTLTTDMTLFTGTTTTNLVGPGFVQLSGTVTQNTLSSGGRINILGGTLRANDTQIGFTSSGPGTLALRGGVLEITGGGTFTRPVSNSNNAGVLNWTSPTSNDIGGNGGFSAYGGKATVNLGGAGISLTWAGTSGTSAGFIRDGYALVFGSTQSNAPLEWQNGIALDTGSTGGVYAAREIRVIKGTGGDYTTLSGTITGSNSTDLIKTGDGRLQLSNNNTYAGNTLIQAGTLEVTGSIGGGTVSSPTTTGTVLVLSNGTLAGTGQIKGGTANNGPSSSIGAILLESGGTVSPGAVDSNTFGDLSATSFTWQSGGILAFDLSDIALQGTVAASDTLTLSDFFYGHTANGTWAFDFRDTGNIENTYSLVHFKAGKTDFSATDFSYQNLPAGLVGVFKFNATGDTLEFEVSSSEIMDEPETLALLLGVVSFAPARFRRTLRRRQLGKTPQVCKNAPEMYGARRVTRMLHCKYPLT